MPSNKDFVSVGIRASVALVVGGIA
jgi:hypothetical protein